MNKTIRNRCSNATVVARWLMFAVAAIVVQGCAELQQVATQVTTAVAAPVPYRFEAANYWGNHYQTIANATDPQDCARRCDADARCRVASFSGPRAPKPWANTCVLRSAVGPRHTEQPDIVSWVKP